mgnify:CR=1 FL=1
MRDVLITGVSIWIGESIEDELLSTYDFIVIGSVRRLDDATNLKDKYVIWTGEVSSVSSSGDGFNLHVVHCGFFSDVLVEVRSDQVDKVINLKEGDKAIISGPYGEFFINDSDAEMLYVGGGAGMAPMRSHLYELFKTIKTGRKVTYWYGGRSRAELFYIHYFRDLEKDFPNFKFYLVLSNAMESDNWKVMKDTEDTEGDGFVGFVHNAVIDQYLTKHEAPEDIEFYFCGPPMMNQAVIKMCDDWGVPPENVRFDDFGG